MVYRVLGLKTEFHLINLCFFEFCHVDTIFFCGAIAFLIIGDVVVIYFECFLHCKHSCSIGVLEVFFL